MLLIKVREAGQLVTLYHGNVFYVKIRFPERVKVQTDAPTEHAVFG